MQPKELRHYTKTSDFSLRCSVKNKVCNLIINNDSCKNIVSTALVDYLKLKTKPHPHPYIIGWIKKDPCIKVTNICQIAISLSKFYQDSVTCNVDMNACHILLGRPWQHDFNATHRGNDNIYMFTWEGKRIVTKPILPPLKPTKEEKPEFISICNQSEFLVKSKETKQRFALVVKEEIGPEIKVPEKMKLMLEEFQRIVHDELPDELPPMRNIQHHIDLIPGASLPNLSRLPDESKGEKF